MQVRGLNPDDMFICGLLHDIGKLYNNNCHEAMASVMLSRVGLNNRITGAIRLHGLSGDKVKSLFSEYALTAEYNLLLEADFHVNGKGEVVTMEDRLLDLKSRYGEHSKTYKDSLDIYRYLKSIE